MEKKKDPFRRGTLGLPSRPRVEEKINPEFQDISDPASMDAFIQKHKHVLNQQDQEIDNLAESNAEEYEPAPVRSEPLKNTRLNKPQPFRQEAPQRRPLPTTPLKEYEEEQEFDEPEQKIEEVALRRLSPQDKQNQKTEEDELPFRLPPDIPSEIRERMLAQHRAEKSGPGKRVITNAPSGEVSRQAPPISEVQLRKKIEEEIKEAIKAGKRPDLEPPKTEARFHVRHVSDAFDFKRFEPVSGCIFYEESEIFVRRFNLVDAANITEAQDTRNLSAFIDAIGATLRAPFNVRDMTYPDFRHLLYWHWLNSYTKSPHDLAWLSKYGNRNIYTVKESNLKFQTPKITKSEYVDTWYEKGYAVPTMRDAEVLFAENLSEKEQRIFKKAQFFAGHPEDTIQDRIDRMTVLTNKYGLEIIENISLFESSIIHGIQEFIDVVDDQFDPHKWLSTLEYRYKEAQGEAKRLADTNESLDEDDRLALEEDLQTLDQQIQDIKGKLERKEVVQPDVESISINRRVLEFFPEL